MRHWPHIFITLLAALCAGVSGVQPVSTSVPPFASTNTGPATTVQRTFDPYGQLASESVNGGAFAYGSSQSWDADGRRTLLGIGNANNYGFGWRADGGLISVSDSTGSGYYSYDTAGLLTSRTVGTRSTSITSRDGEGRPCTIATTVNGVTQLNEAMSWSGDGLLAAHTLNRGDFTDSRSYSYADLSRRLASEQLNLNASTTWTNNFAYDNGVGGGPGVLTKVAATPSSLGWSGIPDSFSRLTTATNSTISYSAYGHVNGQATLSAWLDGQPVSITAIGTNAMQWQAAMELNAGSHQLKVAALHPSGQYTALATNTFTNSIAYQTTGDTFDNAGNITQRIWRNANGTTNRTQMLSWDARGRLHALTERDANNSGYNWTATYDGLSRRLSTTSVLVTNGVAFTSLPTTINSYYDPQVEFLELGVAYGKTTEWKLYGPDLNGQYGGMNGTGGFDGVSPYLNTFYPTISDYRGNILGEVTNGVMNWFAARPTGYGAVPGYRPLALGSSGASVALSSVWRGRWMDITGYHQIGLRPYDPVSGRWLTYDSVWNERDPNYYSFAGGDPVNGFDPDGRCVEAGANYLYNGGAAGQALRDVGGYLDSYNNSSASGGYFTGVAETLVDELAGMSAPSTYVNGLASYGNNVSTVYNDSGILAAGSYAATSWNVGAVWSGTANIDLATGEAVGDWYQRGAEISSGVASTAGVASGGVSLFNWATAPAATAPAAASADTVTPGMEISTYRQTTAGESFYHYGYSEQASGFQNGLRPGGYATSIGDLSGSEAQSGLALRHEIPPNAVYSITPDPGNLNSTRQPIQEACQHKKRWRTSRQK